MKATISFSLTLLLASVSDAFVPSRSNIIVKRKVHKSLVTYKGLITSDNSQLHQVDKKASDFNGDEEELKSITSLEEFELYQDDIARKKAIKSFIVFNGLDDAGIAMLANSLTLMEIKPGEKVISQGDDASAMYFLKSGAVQCFDEVTGKSLSVVKAGGYFGELAIFLDRKRAASVRGKKVDEPNIIWRLDRESTLDIPVGKEVQKYLTDQYGPVRTISDMVSLAKLKLRPKAKRVGLHSTLSVFTLGACFINLISLVSPHMRPYPNLFQLTGMGKSIHLQSLACSGLLFWVMILGTLRVPAKTRYTRKISFNTISAVQLWKVPLSFSNVAGNHPLAIIDAWSPVGRLLIGSTYVMFSIMNFLLLDVVVAGEEDGRDANPFFENMGRGLIASFLFFYAVLRLWLLTCTAFDDKAKAAAIVSTLYPAAGITPSWVGNVNFTLFLYLSMGALYATFQYEKRFPLWATNLMMVVTAFVLLGDTFGCSFPLMYGGKVSADLATYWVSLIKSNPFLQFYVVAPIAGFGYGIFSRIKNKGRRPSSI